MNKIAQTAIVSKMQLGPSGICLSKCDINIHFQPILLRVKQCHQFCAACKKDFLFFLPIRGKICESLHNLDWIKYG